MLLHMITYYSEEMNYAFSLKFSRLRRSCNGRRRIARKVWMGGARMMLHRPAWDNFFEIILNQLLEFDLCPPVQADVLAPGWRFKCTLRRVGIDMWLHHSSCGCSDSQLSVISSPHQQRFMTQHNASVTNLLEISTNGLHTSAR